MCYTGCRYELAWGDSAGECSLPNGEKPPIDSMCVINDIEAENAMLREELAKWERMAAGIKLPEYPISQFQPKDLERENAKLRELVRDMWCCISHIGEYDVFYYDMAEDGCGMSCTVNGEHCCADKLHDRMHKLGIEVEA